MSETDKLVKARQVFRDLCKSLDARNWHYQEDVERLRIDCKVNGKDIPMDLSLRVDVDKQLLMLLSTLPFNVPEDKRLDLAIAISQVNDVLVDGSFDYDVKRGRILFRMTNSFIESDIGNDLFDYLVGCSCQTIDEYNDKMMKVSLGIMSVEDFIKEI